MKVHRPKILGLYYPIGHEVNVLLLHDFCIQHHIRIAFPRVNQNQLCFHITENINNFEIGAYSILEPPSSNPLIIPDSILVPGLAFTKHGHRLGRGKGHYDQYLNTYHSQTFALAFSWMIEEFLPIESHDYIIDNVITPNP